MRRMLTLLALMAVAGCDRAPELTAPDSDLTVSQPSFSVMATADDATPAQLAVAQAVPGFGGYFIANGRPAVYLTDPSERPAAEEALAGFLASFGWTAADLQVLQADYDYLQLDAWYRSSWPAALAVPGSVLSHIDERSNRLSFGGIDASAVSQMASAITQANVPAGAFSVEVTGPVFQVASLRDRIRPPVGGLQLQFIASPVSPLVFLCTLGFNAVSSGVNSFITNSHCSNVQGSTALPTDYYQATRGGVVPLSDNLIAFEVDDPDYTIGGDCPLARRCRYSDAARAQYYAGQEFQVGRVARAAQLNQGLTDGDADPAVLQIDANDPTYRLTAEQARPIVGQVLNKVGRTTGWTRGEVTATCVNISITASDITQLCQSLVDAYVAGGDSGSPVFGDHTDGSAFLAGILWGSSTNLTTGAVQFIFSPLEAVQAELGDFDALDPETSTGPGKRKGHAHAPGLQKKVN